MRLKKETLRAYLDGELSPEAQREAQRLLAASAEARAALAQLKQERDDFTHFLDDLAPAPEALSSSGQAWRRFKEHSEYRPAHDNSSGKTERLRAMVHKPVLQRYRSAIAAAAIVALAVGSLGFAPVRALAGDFLRLFRVESIQVVEVDREQLKALNEDPRFQGLLDRLEPQIEQMEDIEPETVNSIQEAAEAVGFPVVEITALPDDVGARTNIDVHRRSTVHFDLDRELLEALFEAADIDISLPKSLDEKPLVVTQPDTVVQEWRQGDRRTLNLLQMSSPQIDGPEDLDVKALGIAGLQLLGLSETEAQQLGETIDWANTLVLPIPKDARMQVSQVSFNGANGFIFSSDDEEEEDEVDSVLVWTRDGFSYFLSGDYPADQLLAVAKSIK